MASWNPRVNEIFLEAIEAESPAERDAIVEAACQADPGLRLKVEALLRAHEKAGTFLEAPAPLESTQAGETTLPGEGTLPGSEPQLGSTDGGFELQTDLTGALAIPARPIAEGPGSRIGPYKLLQRLGEGGMGVVYMAEQEVPVRRRVALKIIKPGMDSEQVIRRFEAERQALALMDHPGIARVLDAGATDSGRPYFVMELVNGIPITAYCDRERLGPRERLNLFTHVCAAVQHAHQKGVIHRDIKPSNVLVTLIDGQPVPKVIDFGVAKAIDQRLTEKTLFTQFGGIVGTLEYMSPEQAELSGVDIDTRSDVYSLGVLLYELLTGSTPLSRQKLQESGYLEILRRIREEEPPAPSSRLSQSTETLPSISARRSTEPARLARLVRGELDWIVMKALEKDRKRRYETASGLARDIQRYLAEEPVEAGPPSVRYRLVKLLRKHRVAVSTASAFVVLLLLGAVVSTYLAIRATRAERAAMEAARQARDAEQQAKDQRDKALAAEAEARTVSDFLQNDLLAQASSRSQASRGQAPDPEIKVRTLLDRATARIGSRFASQPLVEAATRQTIGKTYYELGLAAEALPHLRRSLDLYTRERGEAAPQTLRAMLALGWVLQDLGDYREADLLDRRVLEANRSHLGPEHPDTLRAMADLAICCFRGGKVAEGEALLKECYEIRRRVSGDEHPDTLWVLNNLGRMHLNIGNYDEARSYLERCVEIRRRVTGEQHYDTLLSTANLGLLDLNQGRLDDAERRLVPLVDACRATLGREHDLTLEALNYLAGVYYARRRLNDADRIVSELLAIRRATLGEANSVTLSLMANLAILRSEQGKFAEARQIRQQVLDLRRRHLGEDHPDTLDAANNLAWLLVTAADLKDRDPARALALAREAIPRVPARLEALAANLWNTTALALYRQSDWSTALDAAMQANTLRHDTVGEVWIVLALVHARLGHAEQARSWYDRAVPWLKANRAYDSDFDRLIREAADLLHVDPDKGQPPPTQVPSPETQPKSPVSG